MKIIKVDQIRNADTFFRRLRGYMFQKKPDRREVLIFDQCNSIHSFNMKFEIDVLFLDDYNKVLKRVLSLQKGRFLPPVKGASRVVEAPAGLFVSVEENEIVSFDLI